MFEENTKIFTLLLLHYYVLHIINISQQKKTKEKSRDYYTRIYPVKWMSHVICTMQVYVLPSLLYSKVRRI